MTRNCPIGVFDSGSGGLTILKEFLKVLPDYDYIYLGDHARAPYGTRSFEIVYEYTLQAVKWFFDQGCELVIIACNTASAKALRTIQQKDLEHITKTGRVLGVIRPTTEIIGSKTKTNHIGIFATTGTVASQSYILELEHLWPNIIAHQQACPMWVPLIENNEHLDPGADYFVQKYIDLLLEQEASIDTILLACTHYPLLSHKIKERLPAHIQVFDQGEIVAKSLVNYLERHPTIEQKISTGRSVTFYTTEHAESFNEKAALFFGKNIQSKHLERL